MPDISMCANDKCDLRLRCFRYRAKPSSFRQSYGTFYPIEGECAYFWPLEEATSELETLKQIEIMETNKQDPDKM